LNGSSQDHPKALVANQQQMLEAQESAGSSNQALQKELETARVEWAKCEVQILHLEDEKRKLTAERDSRRRLEHIVMVYL
jgi:hypothetical protein